MKKIVFTAALLFTGVAFSFVFAQDQKIEKKDKKETEEIIIRKKSDNDSKITVEIIGDKVTVNGKPLSEFKDADISINKRRMIIRDGNGDNIFKIAPGDFEGLNLWNDDDAESSAFLGVTTGVYNDGSKDTKPKGAEITDVTKGSAAEKAGLKTGDVITKINDKKVDDPSSLSDVVTSFKPKEEVTVYYLRKGKESSVKAVLGERKDSRSMAYSFSGPDGMTRSFTLPGSPNVKVNPKIEMWNDKEFGEMMPRTFSPGNGNNFEFFSDAFARKQKLGLKIQDTEDGKGVKVLEVDSDSPAEKAGLKTDDILTEIGGKKVSNTDEVREELKTNAEKSTYNVKAKRNGKEMNFDIKITKKLKTVNL